MSWPDRSVPRRRFLGSAVAVPLALVVGARSARARGLTPTRGLTPALPPRPLAAIEPDDLKHLAWVWQFKHDGERELIRDVLAAHGLGIAMKTHDGSDWMSKYDDSPGAITGPAAAGKLAQFFEDGGVPFHAWGVLHGTDPITEANRAAQILGSGARGMILDLEAHSGFWRGTTTDAERYGAELRRLQPRAFVATSIDARPWEVPRIPLAEFARFTDALAPQVYWGAFNNPNNIVKYRLSGDDPGKAGITPRFALQSALRAIQEFNLPVQPIGDGTVAAGAEWTEFIDEAFASQADAISVWRFGVTDAAVWQLLRDRPPRRLVHTVASGDTLSRLASRWGTSVAAITAENGISNANFLYIGQQLRIPRGSVLPVVTAAASSPPVSSGTLAPVPLSTRRYTVQPGDSLWSIAVAFDTTVDRLVAANQIGNAALIRIGDTLILP